MGIYISSANEQVSSGQTTCTDPLSMYFTPTHRIISVSFLDYQCWCSRGDTLVSVNTHIINHWSVSVGESDIHVRFPLRFTLTHWVMRDREWSSAIQKVVLKGGYYIYSPINKHETNHWSVSKEWEWYSCLFSTLSLKHKVVRDREWSSSIQKVVLKEGYYMYEPTNKHETNHCLVSVSENDIHVCFFHWNLHSYTESWERERDHQRVFKGVWGSLHSWSFWRSNPYPGISCRRGLIY